MKATIATWKMGRVRTWLRVTLVLALALASGCKVLAGRPARFVRNEVIVVGSLGERHLRRPGGGFDLDRLERLLRDLDPHRVFCEVPPDRFGSTWHEFVYTATVDDERLSELPEVTEALYPLALEGRIRLVPCSAWTPEVAAHRASLLEQWRTTRPADTREVDKARTLARERIALEGLENDPLGVNSERYDAIVAEGMLPYERLLDRDLGTGGWRESNLAHYTLIETALDDCAGEGLRVVILFNAWNKYRLLELLSSRRGIELLTVAEALERGSSRP